MFEEVTETWRKTFQTNISDWWGHVCVHYTSENYQKLMVLLLKSGTFTVTALSVYNVQSLVDQKVFGWKVLSYEVWYSFTNHKFKYMELECFCSTDIFNTF